MSDRRVIAVVGISGVGKSTAIARARTAVVFEHLQASVLIKTERDRQGEVRHDSLREHDINDNQALLLSGFRLTAPDSGLVVLDGHTVIDTPDGLVEIASEVFGLIGVSRFVALTDAPEKILQRRLADSERKRPERSVDELHAHQERSILVAHRAALALRIPLVVLAGESVDEITKVLL